MTEILDDNAQNPLSQVENVTALGPILNGCDKEKEDHETFCDHDSEENEDEENDEQQNEDPPNSNNSTTSTSLDVLQPHRAWYGKHRIKWPKKAPSSRKTIA